MKNKKDPELKPQIDEVAQAMVQSIAADAIGGISSGGDVDMISWGEAADTGSLYCTFGNEDGEFDVTIPQGHFTFPNQNQS